MAKQLFVICCMLLAAHTVLCATDSAALECVDGSFAGTQSLFPTDLVIQPGPSSNILSISKVQFAQGFTVEYAGNYKIVNVTNPSPQVYVLYQCGTSQPTLKALPNNTIYMSIPLKAVSVADTTANGFLAELGLLDRVTYATTLSIAPCIQKLYRPTTQGGCARSLEGEQAAAVKSSNGHFTYSASAAPKGLEKAVIVIPATSDPGTLSRAEWIKYVALFFNKETEATKRFDEIADAYSATKAVAVKATGSNKLKVAFTDGTYAPVISFSLAAYKTQYVKDAGGAPLAVDDIETAGGAAVLCSSYDMVKMMMVYGKCGAGSDPTNRAVNTSTAAGAKALRDILKQVDLIVDETYLVTPDNDQATMEKTYGFTAADRTALKVLADKKVYRLDAHVRKAVNASDPFDGMPLEWFETAVVRADLVLADFAAAIAPETAPANYKPAYVRNTASTPVVVVDSTDCQLLKSCTIAPQPICPYVYQDCATGGLKYVTATSRCGPTCNTTTTTTSNTTETAAAAANTTKSANGAAACAPQALLLLLLLLVAAFF